MLRRRQDASNKKKKNRNIEWDSNGKEYAKTKEGEKLSRKEIDYFYVAEKRFWSCIVVNYKPKAAAEGYLASSLSDGKA